MRPLTTCSKCKMELAWGQTPCPSCGTGVEWPGYGKKTAKPQPGGTAFPVRNVMMLVAIIAVAVVALEYITGPKNVPQSSPAVTSAPSTSSASPTAAQPAGPDMNALPHVQELEAQVKAQPANLELRKELGNHLMDARFYDKAIAVYRDILKTRPADANVRVDMGICMKESGDLDGAKAEMKKALTYVPEHVQAHFNLGIVCLVQGNISESNEWFTKTANLAPQSEIGQRARQLLQQHSSFTAP